MKICGIVAEYNPFHNGHMLQIKAVRQKLGGDACIVACMSGDFVQRGDAAIMNKSLRAEAAVRSGADLVLSLPLRYSLSSAQGFADGAIKILGMAGAEYLAFGAEDDDIEALSALAELIAERDVVAGTIKNMEGGLSFAFARERELYNRIKEKAALISKPNNLLAVEYLRAVRQQGLEMEPIAVKRLGVCHDGGAEGNIASASHIRKLIRGGDISKASVFMPYSSYEVLKETHEKGLVMDDLSRLDCAMTAVLSRLTAEDMSRLPDAAEGLENRLFYAAREGRSFDEIAMAAKTKRYALSRIRRMLFCAFLGIEKKAGLPSFTRVLAFNDRGREVLSALPERDDFAFITKPAAVRHMGEDIVSEFELEAEAAGAYDRALPAYARLDMSREWRQGPIYIK